MENIFFDTLDCAVTVCDASFQVIYQNESSVKVNGNVVGTNLMKCHRPESCRMIEQIMATGVSNTYTITKRGVNKLIHQAVWRDKEGRAAGLIELSTVMPEGMKHFDR